VAPPHPALRRLVLRSGTGFRLGHHDATPAVRRDLPSTDSQRPCCPLRGALRTHHPRPVSLRVLQHRKRLRTLAELRPFESPFQPYNSHLTKTDIQGVPVKNDTPLCCFAEISTTTVTFPAKFYTHVYQARSQDCKFGGGAASVFGGRHISSTTLLLPVSNVNCFSY